MPKLTRILSYASAAGVLLCFAGCVTKGTHDKVLSQLAESQTNLATTQAARDTLDIQHRQALSANRRMRDGLDDLAEEFKGSTMKMQSAEDALTKLQSNEKRALACLAELQQILAMQGASIASLEEQMAPLAAQLAKLGRRAENLSGQGDVAERLAITAAAPTK